MVLFELERLVRRTPKSSVQFETEGILAPIDGCEIVTCAIISLPPCIDFGMCLINPSDHFLLLVRLKGPIIYTCPGFGPQLQWQRRKKVDGQLLYRIEESSSSRPAPPTPIMNVTDRFSRVKHPTVA